MPSKQKSPSLREIASKLDVSPGTVSRALANEAGVGADRARQIRDYAVKIGYRPKPMRRKNTRTIGMLISSKRELEPEDPFQASLVLHLSKALSQSGWHFLIEVVDHETEVLPRALWENRTEGIILAGTPSKSLRELLISEGIPAVQLEDTVEDTKIPCVMGDVSGAMKEIVEQFLDGGHHHFGFVYSDIRYASVRARYDTIMSMLGDREDVTLRAVRVPNVSLLQGQVATRQLLQRTPRPTAVIYINDLLAIGGLLSINQLGLRVPDDISIIGHDNTRLGMECEPPLSSVDMGLQELARNAVELLVEQIGNGGMSTKPIQKNLQVNVIWRTSCGPAPYVQA